MVPSRDSRRSSSDIGVHIGVACSKVIAGGTGSAANWQYVAGDFPPTMKWKSNVRDRAIRKIKQLGSRVVTVNEDYTVEELKAARQQCQVETESKK